jgi:DNA polymerase-3 subunit delta
MVNQIRKLLLVKDFVESPHGREWQAACPYDYFQRQVIPAAVEYDRKLLEQLDSWQTMLGKTSDSRNSGSRSKKKKTKTTTDLLIAKNPKNAYPIYLLFKKSERFTKDELLQAVNSLNETERKLKSSSQNAKLVLEHLILSICKK